MKSLSIVTWPLWQTRISYGAWTLKQQKPFSARVKKTQKKQEDEIISMGFPSDFTNMEHVDFGLVSPLVAGSPMQMVGWMKLLTLFLRLKLKITVAWKGRQLPFFFATSFFPRLLFSPWLLLSATCWCMSERQKMSRVMDLPTSILASLFAALMFTRIHNQFPLSTMINYIIMYSRAVYSHECGIGYHIFLLV